MPKVIEQRFLKGKKITVIHGDLNPSNVFVSKKDSTNVKFIDMEAVRIGLPSEDLAMLVVLHMDQGPQVVQYLKQYYTELCKVVKDYSVSEFLQDYKLGVMMTMFHPIGIVGVRLKICDQTMIKRAVRVYEMCMTHLEEIYDWR